MAAGRPDGSLLAADAFEGRYRHSQELLPAIERLLAGGNLQLRDLAGVVVGTGPGAFTGLRVGLATAKTLAHELDVPVVGITTRRRCSRPAPATRAAWLPSGPRDRVLIERGAAPRVGRPATGLPDRSGRRRRRPCWPSAGSGSRAGDAPWSTPASRPAPARRGTARCGRARRSGAPGPRVCRPAPRCPGDRWPEGGVAWSRDPR